MYVYQWCFALDWSWSDLWNLCIHILLGNPYRMIWLDCFLIFIHYFQFYCCRVWVHIMTDKYVLHHQRNCCKRQRNSADRKEAKGRLTPCHCWGSASFQCMHTWSAVEEGEQNGEHNHEVVSWTEYNWQATITTHNMRTVQTKDTLQVSWSIGRML